MYQDPASAQPPGDALLDLYDRAVGPVYAYLATRCGSANTAEELTAETFLAAVRSVRTTEGSALSVPWLLGVARHKLVDHWRRQEREERRLGAVRGTVVEAEDRWDAELDAILARQTLDELVAIHRAVLILRYLDDLPVPEIAGLLGRSVHATESLLARARDAFRSAYEVGRSADD